MDDKSNEYEGIFHIIVDGKTKIATENLVPGNQTYNERLVIKKKIEYRIWDPFRSKLAAIIIKGLKEFPIREESVVLYLGASTGTTVSHISDIVGFKGKIFAVENASRVARDLLDRVVKYRKNIIPIIQDAKHPKDYCSIFGKVDIVYSDIAQPDQTDIAILNCEQYLKKDGYLFIVIKMRSINAVQPLKKIIENEKKKLEKKFEILQTIDLSPYDKDHSMIYARFLG